jgi:hypothetical protein
VLEWQPLASASLIELDRTLPEAPAQKAAPKKKAALALPDEQPTEVRMRSAKDEPPQNDPGGILDHTVLRGQSYVYRAQRIRPVAIAGKKFEIRGAVSSPFTLVMTDTFAPAAPTGLAAIPGAQGNVATIDLSWRPNVEVDVAGYNIYREGTSGSFERLNPTPVTGPAFSDTTAVTGDTYLYRVTALDATGNESPPSSEVTQTVTAP